MNFEQVLWLRNCIFLADGDLHLNLSHESGVLLLELADCKKSLVFLILLLLLSFFCDIETQDCLS